MSRVYIMLLGALASLSLGSAHAQSGGPLLSAEQVRAEFADRGYEVAESVYWTWYTPGLTTFRVRDAATQRLLTVLVYPDQAAADTARVRAEQQSAPLVAGYGASTWRGNVAIVQANELDVRRAVFSEYDREMEVIVRTADQDQEVTSGPLYAVDFDLLGVLEAAIARGNL
jgi:hypothetical protein